MEAGNGETAVAEPALGAVAEAWESGSNMFILSTSGKPVYSRHGSEDRLATLSGVMQALVSFVQSSGDSIRRIRAGNTTIEFLVAEPVTLVAVARSGQSGAQLRQNLTHLHNLLLFILTSTQLQRIYKERKNFDLRRLLAGSERLIDYLIDNLPLEPGFFLSAVPCLLMDAKTRSSIANAIAQTCDKLKEVVFGLVVVAGRVVCQVRMDRYRLHPADTLLVLNLVASTESFKSGETWSPLCLPQFDSSGFLHAYVSYLAEDCPACLLLLTVNKDIFYPLSEAKQKLVERLRRGGHLDTIGAAQAATSPTASALNIPLLRHFLYVLLDGGSYFWPTFQPPYDTREAKTELIAAYRSMHDRLQGDSLKVAFVRRDHECLFAWTRDGAGSGGGGVQLFLVLEPLASPEDAQDCKGKVLTWIAKQEDLLMREDFLF